MTRLNNEKSDVKRMTNESATGGTAAAEHETPAAHLKSSVLIKVRQD